MIALVSRRLYMVAMPLIYQSVYIDLSRSTSSLSSSLTESRTLMARLSAGPSVRALIKNIHVSERGALDPDVRDLLHSWLPQLSQLVSIYGNVDGPCPTTLLNVIGKHWPGIRLHIRTNISYRDQDDIKQQRRFLKLAPNMLRSLQICMPNDECSEGGVAKKKLFWALKNCPGLQSLTTYISPGFWDLLNKDFISGPQKWKRVKLGGPLPQLSEITIADATFGIKDLLKWGGKEGWTKLKKISVWDHRLLDVFQGCEHSLRSIHLIDAKIGYEDALVKICLRTIRLIELKIKTSNSRLPFRALKICGASLITLAIHSRSESISLDFLQAIPRLCPRLTNVTTSLRWPPDNSVTSRAHPSH